MSKLVKEYCDKLLSIVNKVKLFGSELKEFKNGRKTIFNNFNLKTSLKNTKKKYMKDFSCRTLKFFILTRVKEGLQEIQVKKKHIYIYIYIYIYEL